MSGGVGRIQTQIATNVAILASYNTAVIDVREFNWIGFQIHVSTSAATGTFTIQGSHDQVNWVDILPGNSPSGAMTLTSVDKTWLSSKVSTSMTTPYVRVSYVASGGAGTANIWIFANTSG